MKKHVILSAALTFLMLVIAATAGEKVSDVIVEEPSEGAWYLGGYYGSHAAEDYDLSRYGFDPFVDLDFPNKISAERGWRSGITYGYAFPFEESGSRWRLELEMFHSKNTFNEYANIFGSLFYESHGEIVQQGVIFNAYRDFSPWYGISPYVGAGIGLSRTEFELYQGVYNAAPPGTRAPLSDGSDSKYGVTCQIMAGLEYAITENWSVFGEARLSGTFNRDYNLGRFGDPAGPTVSVDGNHINTSFLLGVKYNF